jgi:hypothetical protein
MTRLRGYIETKRWIYGDVRNQFTIINFLLFVFPFSLFPFPFFFLWVPDSPGFSADLFDVFRLHRPSFPFSWVAPELTERGGLLTH